jgi:hypothetical protein
MLRDNAIELVEGEALLAKKKKAEKKAKTKLARENADRAASVVEAAVESIATHRKLLRRQAAAESSAK